MTAIEADAGAETVATTIAAEIHSVGIERVFGIPGGEVLSLIEALRQNGTEFVLCNHESSAGVMASAYGRISGQPGIVLTTLGPGAANLLLPVANAALDREALVAICGDLGPSLPTSHTHQRLDLLGIFAPTCKYTGALTSDHALSTFRAAVAAVTAEPEGAAVLTLSTEAAGAAVVNLEVDGPSPPVPVRFDPAADAVELRTALAGSRRPLAVAGCGAELASAPALREWLTRWQLPIALTPKAKGLVGDDYSRYVGVLDGAGLGALMSRTLSEADLIIGLGLDAVELIRPWHATAPVVWVGNCGLEHELGQAGTRLRSGVAAVTDLLRGTNPPAVWPDWTAAAVTERQALASRPGSLAWIPRALRSALPDAAIVTTDVGAHKCLISQFLPVNVPGRFLTSNGLSAMGYGLPAGIGAKLADPDAVVLSVLGDGGYAMAAQELETAVRMNVPVITVVLVDMSLSLIMALQSSRGLPRCGVDYGRVDILRVAAGYGVDAAMATTPDELTAAIEGATLSRRPTVIAVPVDASRYAELL